MASHNEYCYNNCNKLLELFATMPVYSYKVVVCCDCWFRTLGGCSYSSIAQSFQMMRELYISYTVYCFVFAAKKFRGFCGLLHDCESF